MTKPEETETTQAATPEPAPQFPRFMPGFTLDHDSLDATPFSAPETDK